MTPEVIVSQRFALLSQARHAVFPVVHPKILKKPAVSPKDSKDSMFYARTESSGIFGMK
jgi:hypothetical protein